MRAPQLVAAPLAAPNSSQTHNNHHHNNNSHHNHHNQQQHHNNNHHHHRNSRHSGVAPVISTSHIQTSPNTAAADVMSSALSEQHIFSPGAIVEVQTVTNETITGEVLAFEYAARLLILKSQSSNGSVNSSNVTCLNLELCGDVKVLAEPDADRLAAEGIGPNTKLPDIDIKKLEERLQNAVLERQMLIEAYKNGAGLEGVSLYTRLHKTVGQSFGISWDNDSIIIGKNIRIEKPYGANCITFFNAGPKAPPNLETSLNYAKQLVEKYWLDQNKDPYNMTPLLSALSATTSAAPQQTLAASVVAANTAPASVAPVSNYATKSGGGSSSSRGSTGNPGNRKASPQQHNVNANMSKQQQTQQAQSNHHEAPQAEKGPNSGRSGHTSYAAMI